MVKSYRIKHHALKTCGVVDVTIYVFLTSALVGAELTASRPGRFTPRGKSPRVPIWTRGWVDPRTGLDHMEK
jgi:hypothetical protein